MRISVLLLIAWAASGCGEPVTVGRRPVLQASGAPAASTEAVAAADAGVDGAVAVVYRDDAFVELDVIHRDPFRDFALGLAAQAPVVNPRQVKLRNVSLDQMRLIAVVTGVSVPYAMLVDPDGVGHVVVRGDYVGREEIVNAGGADGMPIALNWRIDRIRVGEVVLSREDPLHPERPPLTRSILLRDAASEADVAIGAISGQLGNTGDANAAANTNSPSVPQAPSVPTPPRRGSSSRTGDDPGAPQTAPAPAPAAPDNGGGGGSGRLDLFGRPTTP